MKVHVKSQTRQFMFISEEVTKRADMAINEVQPESIASKNTHHLLSNFFLLSLILLLFNKLGSHHSSQ